MLPSAHAIMLASLLCTDGSKLPSACCQVPAATICACMPASACAARRVGAAGALPRAPSSAFAAHLSDLMLQHWAADGAPGHHGCSQCCKAWPRDEWPCVDTSAASCGQVHVPHGDIFALMCLQPPRPRQAPAVEPPSLANSNTHQIPTLAPLDPITKLQQP